MATWLEDIQEALRNLGGQGRIMEIADEVERISTRPKPIKNLKSKIADCIQKHSSDSASFVGRHDLFVAVNGIGGGLWAMRPNVEKGPKHRVRVR